MVLHLLSPSGGSWCGFAGWITADPSRCDCFSCIEEVHEHAECCAQAARLADKMPEQSH